MRGPRLTGGLLSLALLAAAGGRAQGQFIAKQGVVGQGFVGGSGQIALLAPKGHPRLSLRLDLGYRVSSWLELGTALGFSIADRGATPRTAAEPARSLFTLEQAETTITESTSFGPGESSGDDVGEDLFDTGREGGSGSIAPPLFGGQGMATGRLLLPRLTPSLEPFIGLEGGIQLLDGLLAAKGAATAGLLYTTKHDVALSLALGYTASRWETARVEQLVLLGMGIRVYF
jgi:hypothetical protein